MIGKNIKFNGTDFSNDQFPNNGIVIQDCDWRNGTTETKVTTFETRHGSDIGFTKLKAKVIKITGKLASASKLERGDLRKLLDYTFGIAGNFNDEDNYKTLEVTDDNGEVYQAEAKVYKAIRFNNDISNPIIDWDVELICKTPYFSSKELYSATAQIGVFGGVSLPTELPLEGAGGYGYAEIDNDSNFTTPCKITAFGTMKKPNVINLDTKKFFKVNQEITNGELIVDSYKLKSYINRAEIPFSTRVDGSYFIFLEKGKNRILLSTEDNSDYGNLIISYNKILA